MRLEKIHFIVIGVVAILLCAGVGAYVLTKNSDSDASLVFAIGNKDCYEPAWIADELGYYAEFGADVDVLTVSGGGKAWEALATGKADIAGFGSTPLVNCLNSNAAGDYVVLARWMGGESYAELAATIFEKEGVKCSYSLYYPLGEDNVEVTLHDGTKQNVKMLPIKHSNITIGLDITTGYDSAVKKYCGAVGLTFAYEGDANESTADLVMKPVEFALQVAALTETNTVDALVGGSYGLAAYFVSNKVTLSIPNVTEYPSLESEATCALIASMDAYVNKYDQIVGVLKALQKASCYIYGLEYTTDILTEESVQNAQNEMSDTKKTELYGTTVASKNGFFYNKEACKMIADIFGYPFNADVQRLSFDNYRWGINFELVDMKLIKNAYEMYKNADVDNKYRTVTGMDYMRYFDGLALYDALKGENGKSSWAFDEYYSDSSVYLFTTYSIKLSADTASEVKMLYLNVENGMWVAYLLDSNGRAIPGLVIDSVKVGDTPVTTGWTFSSGVLTFQNVLTGNVEIKASITP